MNWCLEGFKKYAVFSGRARRKEYWFFWFFNALIYLVLLIVDVSLGTFIVERDIGLLTGLYSLAVMFPWIAVSVRRLHDIGKSGWWQLIVLVPCVGTIVLLLFFVRDSDPGDNEYGPNPKMT
jgi:uncharacterized membrane protein YhaH (DUF805 family)